MRWNNRKLEVELVDVGVVVVDGAFVSGDTRFDLGVFVGINLGESNFECGFMR